MRVAPVHRRAQGGLDPVLRRKCVLERICFFVFVCCSPAGNGGPLLNPAPCSKTHVCPNGEKGNAHRRCRDYSGHSYTGHDDVGRDDVGHTYIGHNFIDHTETGNNSLGHPYFVHNYFGHTYLGHDYSNHNHLGHNCLGHSY